MRRRGSDLTSRCVGLGLSDLFGVGLARCPRSSLIISLFVRCPGRRPVKTNNCSLTHAAASWEIEHLELLFAPGCWRAGQTGVVGLRTSQLFGILAQYQEQRVLTYAFARPVWCFSNYCSLQSACCQGIISYDINYIRG